MNKQYFKPHIPLPHWCEVCTNCAPNGWRWKWSLGTAGRRSAQWFLSPWFIEIYICLNLPCMRFFLTIFIYIIYIYVYIFFIYKITRSIALFSCGQACPECQHALICAITCQHGPTLQFVSCAQKRSLWETDGLDQCHDSQQQTQHRRFIGSFYKGPCP